MKIAAFGPSLFAGSTSATIDFFPYAGGRFAMITG
jgi:hypothetical protein